MKILMISTDRQIFNANSEVRTRMKDYAGLFERLDIIVFAKQKLNLQKIDLAGNCAVYSTNSWSALVYVWSAFWLGRKILANQSEEQIITCQDPFETGLAGYFLARRGKIKLHLQIHTDFLSPFFWRESLKNKIRVCLTKFLLPRADGVRVVSERIKKSLANFKLKTEPIVLPIFVEPKKPTVEIDLRREFPPLDFIVLMASRLTREKNFPLALRVFARAEQNTGKKFGLFIVGSGPEREKIVQLREELNLKNVSLVAWSGNMAPYFLTFDLFLLTSNYEGYGRTLVEAGQAGCPILTTNVGLVGDIINHNNALICPVGDEKCLTSSLLWAIDNSASLRILAGRLSQDLASKTITDKSEYLKKYQESLSSIL